MKPAALSLLFLLFVSSLSAQLRPGFDKSEYLDLLRVSAQFGDTSYASKLPPALGYRMLYRSPVMGLQNRWDLWTGPNNTGIISVRGTTQNEVSWLANFYAAMVPARGSLQLGKDERFDYDLASNPSAAVHVGWLTATGFLSKDMLPRIDSAYRGGVRNWLIVGHSQGGAIAFLLTAHLYSLQRQGKLPTDIRFKTYCSAGPKPGNHYFAYEYEAMTQEGWAYNVINALDWVPQSPFSVQTVDDFVPINPFVDAKGFIRKQKWPRRWALNIGYNQLTKPSRKAAKKYEKFLGEFVSKAIRKNLPGFESPAYVRSSDYVRAGNTIVLTPDSSYLQAYPQKEGQYFVNHLHGPYYFLTERLTLTTK